MTEAGHLEARHPFSPIKDEGSPPTTVDAITPRCPDNVSPKAWEFLGVARERGALGELIQQPSGNRKAEVLGLFIGQGLSLEDIVTRLGIGAKKDARYLIIAGARRVWESLSVDVQQQFPLEKITSLRELHNPEWK